MKELEYVLPGEIEKRSFGEKNAKSALILFNLFYLFNNNVYGEILNDYR